MVSTIHVLQSNLGIVASCDITDPIFNKSCSKLTKSSPTITITTFVLLQLPSHIKDKPQTELEWMKPKAAGSVDNVISSREISFRSTILRCYVINVTTFTE